MKLLSIPCAICEKGKPNPIGKIKGGTISIVFICNSCMNERLKTNS